MKSPSDTSLSPLKRVGGNFWFKICKQNSCSVKVNVFALFPNVTLFSLSDCDAPGFRQTGLRQVCSLEEHGPRMTLCVVSHGDWLLHPSLTQIVFNNVVIKEKRLKHHWKSSVKCRQVHSQLVGTGWPLSALTGQCQTWLVGALIGRVAKYFNYHFELASLVVHIGMYQHGTQQGPTIKSWGQKSKV